MANKNDDDDDDDIRPDDLDLWHLDLRTVSWVTHATVNLHTRFSLSTSFHS